MWVLILLPAEREFPEPDLRTKWFSILSSTPSRTAT